MCSPIKCFIYPGSNKGFWTYLYYRYLDTKSIIVEIFQVAPMGSWNNVQICSKIDRFWKNKSFLIVEIWSKNLIPPNITFKDELFKSCKLLFSGKTVVKKSLSGSFGVRSKKPYMTESLGSAELGISTDLVSVGIVFGTFWPKVRDFLALFFGNLSICGCDTTFGGVF